MKIKDFKRKCPNCNKDIFYSNEYYLKRGINTNGNCTSCASTLSCTNKMRKDSSIRMKETMSGRTVSDEEREKLRKLYKGKKRSRYTIDKMKAKLTGKKRGPHTREHKLKIRLSTIEYIRTLKDSYKSDFHCMVGKNEDELLNQQEKIDNCTIIRQYQIKELGYFVDGYCKETNTVYEVYEPFHDRNVLKDFERECNICNCLGCDFIIIWLKH